MIALSDLDLRDVGESRYNCSCPFPGCNSKPTSFGIKIDDDGNGGTYNCFKCNRKGRIVYLKEKGDNLFLLEPGETLNGHTYQSLPYRPVQKKEKSFDPPPDDIAQLLADVVSIYQKQYAGSEGFEYLKARGLTKEGEPNSPVGVGYVPGGYLLKNAGLNLELLESLNLVWSRSDPFAKKKVGLDKMWKRVILPYQWQEKITSLHGRTIQAEHPMPHLYTPCHVRIDKDRPEVHWVRGVYNEEALKQERFMIVEGALDALGATITGQKNVIAIGGVSNKTALFTRIRENQVVHVCLDTDQAGNSAWEEFKEKLGDRAIKVSVPGGFKDWADYAKDRYETRLKAVNRKLGRA